MKSRGRTPSAVLELVAQAGIDAVGHIERPAAPSELSDEQAAEWRIVVNRLPADWFPAETHAVLAQYCRHVVAARRIGQLIAQFEAGEDFNVREYETLLKMQDREGRAMSLLATRMRMTQQSTYDKSRKKPAIGFARPWEA